MVKHIVFFKLKEFSSQKEKVQKMNEIKEALEALKDTISVVHRIFVGLNINPAETWDIALEVETDSMKDIMTYAVHPAHVAVAKNIIGPVKIDRACVDFEM